MEIVNFKPTGSNVLVRIMPEDLKTSGGLFLPGTSTNNSHRPIKCVVESVGPGIIKNGTREEMTVEVGDVILTVSLGPVTIGSKRVCNSYLDSDWEDLFVVELSEIMAVLETSENQEGF